MKHKIMMVDRENGIKVVYDDAVGYEVQNGGCLWVLNLCGGDTASFDKESWDMYDLSPQKGWNERACEI